MFCSSMISVQFDLIIYLVLKEKERHSPPDIIFMFSFKEAVYGTSFISSSSAATTLVGLPS